MKTCKKCKREFEPDKKNRILCEYCRNIKKDIESLSEFVYKSEKYNKEHGTNYSYGQAQALLFFGKIKL